MSKDVTIDYSKPLKRAMYERFCQEYMKDSNASQSVIRAGYSKNGARATGSKLLTITNISKRLEYLNSIIAKESKLTVQSIVEDIKDTHRRAKLDSDYKCELKASDMLMKHTGGYEKDNEQSKIVIERALTESELKERLAVVEQAGNGIDTSSIG